LLHALQQLHSAGWYVGVMYLTVHACV
jgi:hypothetical protein